jgi:hypothetical protein
MNSNVLMKSLAGVICSVFVLASCSGSDSSSSSDSTTETTAVATKTTLALSEFSTSALADVHIGFVREAMSVYASNMVSDAQIISAAQNVCNEVRTRGVDAWVNEVESKRNIDSSMEWSIRIRSTVGAVHTFCYEFKEEFNEHPISSKW